jgi:hypothetical protein
MRQAEWGKTIWLSTIVAVLVVLTVAASASAAQPSQFVDLGRQFGTPSVVSNADEVFSPAAVWRSGATVTPGPVAGADSANPAMTMVSMSPDGLVVGDAIPASGSGLHSVYWDSMTTTTPQFYPSFTATESNQCGGSTEPNDAPRAVDSADEIGGTEEWGLTLSGGGCQVTEHPFIALKGASDELQAGSAGITALQPNWMVTLFGGPYQLVPRSGGATVNLGLDPTNSYGLAADGSTVGVEPGSSRVPAFSDPEGDLTPLTLPAGADPTTIVPYAMNDSHEIVGSYRDTSGNSHDVVWTSPSAPPTSLDSLAPAGWTLLAASAINAAGDIAGIGRAPDGSQHAFLLSVAPPDLSVSIKLSTPAGEPFSGPASPGQTFVARVTLSEAATALHPITGITVDEDGLTVSPSTALEYVSGTNPSTALSLTPGQSTSYEVLYKVASAGAANLSVTANGTENSEAVSAHASVTAHLSQPLSVSVAFEQNGSNLAGSPLGANTIKLADNDSGEIPQTVTAVVTVKNVSSTEQEHVAFQGTPAVSFHDPAHATPPLPFGVSAGPSPASLPNLAPGASTTASFTLTVSGNGIADLTPQLLSTDAGTDDNNVSQGLGTLTALPTAILWLSLQTPASLQGLIPAGNTVTLTGTVTNRSLTNSVDVTPIVPTSSGNVQGGILQGPNIGPLPDGVQPGYVGTLAPGAEQAVTATVTTSPVAGTRGELAYQPAGLLVNNDGSTTTLSGAQLGTASDSSPVVVHISTADPAIAPSGLDTVAASFTEAAMLNSSKWMAANLTAGANLLTSGNLGSALGGAAVSAVRGTAKVIVSSAQDAKEAAWFLGALYTLRIGWESLTPEERAGFADQIAADFESSNLAADYKTLDLTASTVSKKLFGGLTSFFSAYESGDYDKAAALAGEGFSNVGDTALSLYIGNLATQKLALGIAKVGASASEAIQGQLARAVTLEDALRDANATTTLGKGVTGITEGQNLLINGGAAALKYFGVDPTMLAKLRAFCQENKIIVAVRTRSAQAAELIKKGLAVGKNEAIKIKNVNEIDVKYLGYQAHDINTVVWAEPISREKVLSEISELSQTEQDVVLARYDLRVQQWNNPKIRKVIEHGEKTGFISWDFDGTSNGAAYVRKQNRRFGLYKTVPKGSSSERYYAKVLVGREPGKLARLVPITQDVDMMALLQPNGALLPANLRAKAYAYLSNILGIEHGETPSWLEDGEIIFQAKAKQLADTIPGGEPLLIAGPDGSVRAGFYDPQLTIFDKATKTGYIIFKGGYNNPFAVAITKLVVSVKGFTGS